MPTTLSKRDHRRKETARSLSPKEIEARQLLLLGEQEKIIAQITGLPIQKLQQFSKEITAAGPGPYSLDVAGFILGVSYRVSHHYFVRMQQHKPVLNDEYAVSRDKLRVFAENWLRKWGERRAIFLLFTGRSKEAAAVRGRMSASKIEKLAQLMDKIGVGPKSTGPYTAAQAAFILGMPGRQVRMYCKEGRFGHKWANFYQVERSELIAYGAQDRRAGCPPGHGTPNGSR